MTAATDTARLAHVLLPAAAWGEKDGTVTNSERRISRQRTFLPLPGDARPDWWIICEVASRMGHGEAFAYSEPAEIFAEHAALSGFENGGARDFDIGALAGIDGAGYEDLEPLQWPRTSADCRPRAPVRRRPLLHARCEGALRRSARCCRAAAPRRASRSRSTPDACAITGTP